MKKYIKLILIASLILNVFFLGEKSLPKYSSIGSNNQVSDFKRFDMGGYVKGLNFQEISSEFYLIFSGKTEYLEDGTEITDYYYINGLQSDGITSHTGLKELKVKSFDTSKIELFDDMYTFEVYKNGKVLGKDKNGEMFELLHIKKI